MTHARETVEGVVSERPFRMLRTVRWSDCDPAGIVHAGRYSDYIYSAVDLFLDGLWGAPASSLKMACGVTTPLRRLEIIFDRSLHPGDRLEMGVTLIRCSGRSFTLGVTGARTTREGVFRAEVVFVSVDLNSREPVGLPPPLHLPLAALLPSTASPPPASRI